MAAKKWPHLPGWSTPNKGTSYINAETGQVLSRRQYDKLRRGDGLSNEMISKLNKASDLEAALSRPARGRKSLAKLSDAERQFIAEARVEDFQRKAEIKAEKQAKGKLSRAIQRKVGKRVKRRRITYQMLNPGSKGARTYFNGYKEYLELFYEGKNSGLVFSYGLGMVGVDSREEYNARDLAVTVFTMHAFDRPIPEERFNREFEAAILERSYFEFANYFMHVAFKKDVYTKRAKDKRRVKKGKKRK